MSAYWRRVLGWDGILPLIVVLLPTVLLWLFPREDAVIGFFSSITALFVAMLRAHFGYIQLSGPNGELPTIRSQILLALAIVILLVFESLAIGLQLADDEPLIAYAAALGIYVTYLLFALTAFLPSRASEAGDWCDGDEANY